MPHYIKTGFWDKLAKAPKGYLNLDLFVQDIVNATAPSSLVISNEVFYVQKKFTGLAGVTLDNAGAITSTNASYNQQLAEAVVGDPFKPYPCIWSARNAARAAILAGTISKATVYVQEGYTVTCGSTVNAENGPITPNNALSQEVDIKMTSTASLLGAFSWYLPDLEINYYFEENTHVYNLCKTFTIEFCFNTVLPTRVLTFKVEGFGSFYTVYGPLSGFPFVPRICNVTLNGRVFWVFEGFAVYGHVRGFGNITNYAGLRVKLTRLWTRGLSLSFVSTINPTTLGLNLNTPNVYVDIDDLLAGVNNTNTFSKFTIPQVDELINSTQSSNAISIACSGGVNGFVNIKSATSNLTGSPTDGHVARVSLSGTGAASGNFTNQNVIFNYGTCVLWMDGTKFGALATTSYLGPMNFGSTGSTDTSAPDNFVLVRFGEYVSNSTFGCRFFTAAGIQNTNFIFEALNAKFYETNLSSGTRMAMTPSITSNTFGNRIIYRGQFVDYGSTNPMVRVTSSAVSSVPVSGQAFTYLLEGEFNKKLAGSFINLDGSPLEFKVFAKNVTAVTADDAQLFAQKNSGTTPHTVVIQNVMTNATTSVNAPTAGDTLITYLDLDNNLLP